MASILFVTSGKTYYNAYNEPKYPCQVERYNACQKAYTCNHENTGTLQKIDNWVDNSVTENTVDDANNLENEITIIKENNNQQKTNNVSNFSWMNSNSNNFSSLLFDNFFNNNCESKITINKESSNKSTTNNTSNFSWIFNSNNLQNNIWSNGNSKLIWNNPNINLLNSKNITNTKKISAGEKGSIEYIKKIGGYEEDAKFTNIEYDSSGRVISYEDNVTGKQKVTYNSDGTMKIATNTFSIDTTNTISAEHVYDSNGNCTLVKYHHKQDDCEGTTTEVMDNNKLISRTYVVNFNDGYQETTKLTFVSDDNDNPTYGSGFIYDKNGDKIGTIEQKYNTDGSFKETITYANGLIYENEYDKDKKLKN